MFSAYRIARVFNLIRVLAQLKSDLLDLQNFLWRFKMSSDKVTYSCATCSNAIRGREHFAICVLCPRRVHRKCYGGCLSNDIWAVLRRTFTCNACKSGMATGLSRPDDSEEHVPVLASRGQQYNSNYCSDSDQLVIEESRKKTLIGSSQKDGQSNSGIIGPSLNLGNISTADSARISTDVDVSIALTAWWLSIVNT